MLQIEVTDFYKGQTGKISVSFIDKSRHMFTYTTTLKSTTQPNSFSILEIKA